MTQKGAVLLSLHFQRCRTCREEHEGILTAKHVSHMHILLFCLILFQANEWVQVSPTGTAPTARAYQSGAWDSTNRRLWVFGGYDGPLLSGVDHLHFLATCPWNLIQQGKCFKKRGAANLNDLHYYDVQALLLVSGWRLGLECWDVVTRDPSRFSS